MTRILLCYQPTDGGVGRHVSDLAIGLGERGYEIVLCGPAAPGDLAGRIPFVPLDLGRQIAPRADLAALAGFARILRDVRPDIVHAHSSKAGAVARLVRLSHPRTPVIYTPHGYAFAGYFSRPAERLAYRGIERSLAPLASCVVCVCDAEARLARSVGPSGRVRVIYNGIEPAGEGPVDARIAELSRRGPVIGALTLLRPGKGIETLIDAMPRVLAGHPSTQLAILGQGPDLGALRGRARLHGVTDAVHFLGPSAAPLEALRGMDVFVHPSWAEAFPYVILEAMSLGRPIVASDVGGIGEALRDGESGVLVAPRDDAALAGALVDMLDDPDRRERLGATALERVGERFTRAMMVERLASVYDELARFAPVHVQPLDPRPESPPPRSPQAMTHNFTR
ncbi:MAG TPA: glycosyltransferase [Solirubrobacteraceae bacterium]|nr:glycosyltransferase [Solirubrobacteraceae bacterium]